MINTGNGMPFTFINADTETFQTKDSISPISIIQNTYDKGLFYKTFGITGWLQVNVVF